MNPVLIAALGLTGLSAAVVARRILAEKRRIHTAWQRQGGTIAGTAEGAPEKHGMTAGEQAAEREGIIRAVSQDDPSFSPQDILNAGGTLEDIEGALYGVGNYEFVKTRF